MAVIDASVAVRWFVEGSGSERAAAWLERDDLIAPDLIVAEAGNALWRYVEAGVLPIADADSIVRQLPGGFARLVGTEELAPDALRLAAELRHPLYDCLYLTLARREGQDLVTLDHKLAKLAAQIGLRVELIAE